MFPTIRANSPGKVQDKFEDCYTSGTHAPNADWDRQAIATVGTNPQSFSDIRPAPSPSLKRNVGDTSSQGPTLRRSRYGEEKNKQPENPIDRHHFVGYPQISSMPPCYRKKPKTSLRKQSLKALKKRAFTRQHPEHFVNISKMFHACVAQIAFVVIFLTGCASGKAM
jgi:hypothetical protein